MGGGGRSIPHEDRKKLEEQTKERIKLAQNAKSRNVFISFAYENMDEVNLLRGQVKKDGSELEFSDYSVKQAFDSANSNYIKREICKKIEKASVTMVYLSKESMNSPWVKWEIEKSKEMNKGVIGVYKGNTPPTNLPIHIKDNVSDIVEWKHNSIMKAVEKASKNR